MRTWGEAGSTVAVAALGVLGGTAGLFAQSQYWWQPLMIYSDPAAVVRMGDGRLMISLALSLLLPPSVCLLIGPRLTLNPRLTMSAFPVGFAALGFALLQTPVAMTHWHPGEWGAQLLPSYAHLLLPGTLAFLGLITWRLRVAFIVENSAVGRTVDGCAVTCCTELSTLAVLLKASSISLGPELR